MGDFTRTVPGRGQVTYEAWSPQTAEAASMQFGSKWPGVRQQIAAMRAGAPGATAPMGSDAPGYVKKIPEDQRFIQWLLESLISGGPREELGSMSSRGYVMPPEDAPYDQGTAGSGYTR